MGKEQLEKAKKILNHIKGYGIYDGNDDIEIFEWLIQQAERVRELEEENKRQREALEEIEEHAVWGMFTNKYVIMARKGLGLLKEEGEE